MVLIFKFWKNVCAWGGKMNHEQFERGENSTDQLKWRLIFVVWGVTSEVNKWPLCRWGVESQLFVIDRVTVGRSTINSVTVLSEAHFPYVPRQDDKLRPVHPFQIYRLFLRQDLPTMSPCLPFLRLIRRNTLKFKISSVSVCFFFTSMLVCVKRIQNMNYVF